MKSLLLLLIAIGLVVPAMAETYDVRYGTIEVPDDFVFKHTGTMDSFMGTLTRKSDAFTITFDLGKMSGVHMSEGKKAGCTYFRSHLLGGLPACTGIGPTAKGQEITTSVQYDGKVRRNPANFWAEIRKDSDIADFLLIIGTYQPKAMGL